jgi:hypothetical protein
MSLIFKCRCDIGCDEFSDLLSYYIVRPTIKNCVSCFGEISGMFGIRRMPFQRHSYIRCTYTIYECSMTNYLNVLIDLCWDVQKELFGRCVDILVVLVLLLSKYFKFFSRFIDLI